MPIISPWIFYLIGLVNNLFNLSIVVMVVCPFVIVCLLFFQYDEDDDVDTKIKTIKRIKLFTILLVISTISAVMLPNKETMYTMLVADSVTYENLDKASDVIHDGVDYIFEKLDGEEE